MRISCLPYFPANSKLLLWTHGCRHSLACFFLQRLCFYKFWCFSCWFSTVLPKHELRQSLPRRLCCLPPSSLPWLSLHLYNSKKIIRINLLLIANERQQSIQLLLHPHDLSLFLFWIDLSRKCFHPRLTVQSCGLLFGQWCLLYARWSCVLCAVGSRNCNKGRRKKLLLAKFPQSLLPFCGAYQSHLHLHLGRGHRPIHNHLLILQMPWKLQLPEGLAGQKPPSESISALSLLLQRKEARPIGSCFYLISHPCYIAHGTPAW